MGIVNEAVQDGVGEGWLADDIMPARYGELAGDEDRAAAMAILHHLQQVALLLGGHRGKSPVVEDQELDAGQGPESLTHKSPNLTGSGKSAVTFDKVAIDRATHYAAEDADITLRLWLLFRHRLLKIGRRGEGDVLVSLGDRRDIWPWRWALTSACISLHRLWPW